jgi:ribonuclease BN (tRNA processing enzyme)
MYMKKWILGVVLGVLLTATAGFGFLKYKTGMGPLTLLKVQQGGFQTDPAILQQLSTAGQPLGRWKEGLMFDGVSPMPWMKSAANWFPGTEVVQKDEIRVTFMGSSPLPRPGQMGTSVYVELGNGHHFIFDFGPGSIANYLAAKVPLNQINDIFLTHLHWDHVDSVAYAYMFGAWGGRWHEKYRIYGPSGREPKFGTKYMMDRMDEMLTWHKASFDISPIGQGFEMDVHEFDYKDDGGLVYDKDGVKISHWRQSHTEDGASAYRLDWNGMCVAFTGDGRPNSLTIKYAKGCDLLITEIQPEIIAVSSSVMGVMPFIGRVTLDQAHNPAYAAGYLYNQVKPRMAMATHVSYDPYVIPEIIAEVRENWKGPFHFGAPDMVVVNMTRDKIWVRDGVVPLYPNAAPPQFDMAEGGLIIPAPKNTRSDVQSQDIRDSEIDPNIYYPKGYKPDLVLDWPSPGKPVFLPESKVPDQMKLKQR